MGTDEDKSHLPAPTSFNRPRPVGLKRRKKANGAPVVDHEQLQQQHQACVSRRRGRHAIDQQQQRVDEASSSSVE